LKKNCVEKKRKGIGWNRSLVSLKKKSKCDLEGSRGRMILNSDRLQAVGLIDEAVLTGAAKYKACTELEMSVRTYQRWVADGGIKTDGSPSAIRPEPKNKLSVAEREHLLAMINNADFKSMPASQILPTLADEGFIHAWNIISVGHRYIIQPSASQ
jgi:hypothetical protein